MEATRTILERCSPRITKRGEINVTWIIYIDNNKINVDGYREIEFPSFEFLGTVSMQFNLISYGAKLLYN